MISLTAAQACIAATTPPPSVRESVALEDASGRILAESPRADIDQPTFDRVTMDGYAVRSCDLPAPGTLHCVGTLTAGAWTEEKLRPGECLQIMTGAPLPPGADAVVPVERTKADGASIQFEVGVEAGSNVHPRGRDLRAGQAPLSVGARLHACVLPLLATLGRRNVQVFRRPRVSVLVSGDELVDPDCEPRGGQIRESNRFALAAQILSAGGTPTIGPPIADDRAALQRALQDAMKADVLLLTGGSSVGIKDFSAEVVSDIGAHCHFERVSIKPGKPVLYFTRGDQQIFCLPGNPVSAFVTFEVLVRPALEARSGASAAWPTPLQLPLLEELRAPKERTLLQIARIESVGGHWAVRPLRWSGSGDLVTLHEANALIEVAAGCRVDEGQPSRCWPLRSVAEHFPRADRPWTEPGTESDP